MKHTVLQHYIDAFGRACSIEEVHSLSCRLCEDFGFDHFIFGARLPTSFVKPFLSIVSGFPEEWWDRYKQLNYMQIDPTVAHCATKYLPLDWSSLAPLLKENASVRQFMEDARDFGLVSGISFPVHSAGGETGMFSLVSAEDHQKTARRIDRATPYAHLITAHMHEAVRRLVGVMEIGPGRIELTDREKECLLWAAEGKTAWEASQILGISERTVIFHLQNAADKLGATSRQQSVARAISLGILLPQFG
jgi:DNA-binding CsgD family transcriptional regulator